MALLPLAGSTLRTRNENVIRQCSILCPVIIRQMRSCLGDIRCKYIPVRRIFSAELVILPSDKIFVYTAMYVGPLWQGLKW